MDGVPKPADPTPRPAKKLTKKRLLRLKRKAELRQCYEQKRQKSKGIVSSDAAPDVMATSSTAAAEPTSAGDVEEKEAEPAPKQKHNEKRLRKADLPIQRAKNARQKRVVQKELARSNVATARRLSKKKVS